MDRLFKKRTISVKEARRDPSRHNSGNIAEHSHSSTAGPSSGAGEGGKEKTLSLRRKKKGRKGTLDSVTEGQRAQDQGEGSRQSVASGISTVAPSLNMDFRSSLIMPGLEQRFSVLLPSLSAIPESSLRQLLEGQRARNGNDLGPTITVGEEKLLFAELHQMAHAHRRRQEAWERAPATDPTWSTVNLARWEQGAFEPSAGSPPVPALPQGRDWGVQSYMSGSSSTPNLSAVAGGSGSGSGSGSGDGVRGGYEAPMSAMDLGGRGYGHGHDGMAIASPPPTSASFDSLATFGQNGSGSGSGGVMGRERAMSRTKAYGFGGGARMQEDMYLRRTRKESGKDLGGSTSTTGRSVGGRSDESAERVDGREGIVSPLSPTYDEPSWRSTERETAGRSHARGRAASPSESDRTATPTSAIPLSARKFTRHSPSSSLSLNLPPQPPAPTSPPPETPSPASFSDTLSPVLSQGSARSQGQGPGQSRGAPRQRKSMMASLSAAQMKRISMALVEIGRELEAMGIHSPDLDALHTGSAHKAEDEDAEEMLDPDASHEREREEGDGNFPRTREGRERAASMTKSDSGMSTGSSVFPYHVSPTTGSFTAAHARQASGGAGKGIPPSPKSANLAGQVLRSPSVARLELPPPASSTTSASFSPAPAPAPSTTPATRNLQPLVIQEGSRPQPVLKPTRTQPARHLPTSSTGSSSSIASAVPGYIPGQPRPIGAYRSDGSASSRSGTPTAADAHGTLSIARSRSGSSPTSSPTPVRTALSASSGMQSMSLERSQSVQQGMASPAMVPGVAHHRNASLNLPEWDGRRSTSPLVHNPPIRAGIEEEDEAADDAATATDQGTPLDPELVVPTDDEDEDITVQQIPGKYSVARSRSDAGGMKASKVRKGPDGGEGAKSARDASEERERANGMLDVRDDHRALRVVSHQAQVEGSEHSHAPSSQARAMSAAARPGSVSGQSDGSCWHSSEDEMENDIVQTAGASRREADGEESGKILWEMTGLGVVEMREMQARLVKRAKEEREALRSMGESPAMLMSPALLDKGTDLPAVPGFSRAASPLVPTTTTQAPARVATPTAARAATPTASRAATPTAHAALMSPRSEAQSADRPAASASAAAQALIDRRPAPPPPQAMSPAAQTPSDYHDDIVKTPSSTGHGASPRAKVALGDDPEVRRDFEARIAAATAALQRGPSVGGNGKLERKGTKRAAIKISSPKLVSSSSSISATPLTPASEALRSVSGGSDRSGNSGPAHKLSLKWRKAFKRGPSVSSREVFTPPASASSMSTPGTNTPTPIAEMYAQAQSASGSKLEEPISLNSSSSVTNMGTTGSGRKTPQHDLGGFRFPLSAAAAPAEAPGPYGLPSSPGTANPTSGLRQMMGKIRRGRSDEVAAAADQPKQTMGGGAHVSRPSEDPAVAKFIAAGRALGMTEQQLNELLAAKAKGAGGDAHVVSESAITAVVPAELGGMASGGETAATSIRSNGSAALTGDSSAVSRASPSPVTPGVAVVHSLIPSGAQGQDKPNTEVVDEETRFDRREGLAGLVRALSKNKKRAPKEAKGHNANANATAAEGAEAAAAERRRVVRRTLLMPDSGIGGENGSITSGRSPRSPRSPRSFTSGAGQPASPAPSGSTPALGGRKPSIRRKPIALSREDARLVEDSGSPVSHIRTLSDASARMMMGGVNVQGGSGNVGLGFLGADAPEGGGVGRKSVDSARQGIEITEYDDGQMVWNVVDGLRGRMALDEDDEDAASADSEYTQTGTHSRGPSFSISHTRGASFASTASGGADRRGSNADAVPPSPRLDMRAGTVPLALRSRGQDLRPKTNLYFTSPNDVADLIDQLSRDDGGSGKGRIDFSGSPFSSPPPVPSFPSVAEPSRGAQRPMEQQQHIRTPPQQSGYLGHDVAAGQFEDAPSPLAPARSPVNAPVPGLPSTPTASMTHARTASAALAHATATRRSPPAPINVGRANGRVPAGGWSPKRQVYLRQGFGKSPVQHGSGMGSFSGAGAGAGSSAWSAGGRNEAQSGEEQMDSPGAQSYMSGSSAGTTPNRAVEDRLQALMDRLVRSGAAREG